MFDKRISYRKIGSNTFNTRKMMKYVYIFVALTLACLSLNAQETFKVQGTVFDYLTLQPVAQANISVKNTEGVTFETAQDGTFAIEVPSTYSVLVISFPGYQVKEYPLYGNRSVKVKLVPEGLDAGENRVRLPYSTSDEKSLNGSYGVISKGYDKSISYRDVYQMLEGNVAGLQMNAYSGVPGEGAQLNIGGIRSLYTSNGPLLIVDGLPVVNQLFTESVTRGNLYNFLSDINVKDIESITVLKDAAAMGIYGSRAANGAIVITTKEGTNGKSILDVSVQQGVSLRFNEIHVLNAPEYISYLSGKLYGQGLDAQTINRQFPFFTNNNANTIEYWRYANNTNWQEQVTRNALSQDYYLNLRGGDATSKYSLHIGYNDAEGVGKGISANRFTSRFNLDFRISPKLSAGMRIGYSRTNKNLMDQGYEERVNPLYLSLVKPPILAPFQKSNKGVDGPFLSQPDFDLLSNPLAVTSKVKNEILNSWLMGTVFAQYDFSKNVRTKVTLGIDRKGLEEDRFTPANGIVPINNDLRFDRTSEEQMITDQIMSIEHILTFDKQLSADSRFSAFGGYNLEFSNYESIYGYSIHSTSDDYQGLGDGMKLAMDGVLEDVRNLSFFLNGDYAFREKFLVKAGVRMDGSSKFGEDVSSGLTIGGAPFAVLPYTGLTWKLKGESWLKDSKLFDEFNLRTSWGLTANQDIPVNARHSLYESNFYTFHPGISPATLGNPAIQWETTRKFNAGMDLLFAEKSLGVHLDYFNAKTTDMLVPERIDGSNGTDFYWSNGGAMQNNGIDLGIKTLGHKGDFVWNIGLNMAKYWNEVISLPDGLPLTDGLYEFTSLADEGREAGLIYGYQTLGVFMTEAEAVSSGLLNDRGIAYRAGDFHYADLKQDGMINEQDMIVIGNPNPKLFGGVTLNLMHKNFSLESVFSYSYGNDILNVLRMKLETGSGYENQSVTVLGKWQTEGDITNIPDTKYGDLAGNRLPSTQYIEDGSYFKMKSITLTYTIPKQISFLRTAQVYISGYNLLSFTNYLGWDPETAIGQNNFYPWI